MGVIEQLACGLAWLVAVFIVGQALGIILGVVLSIRDWLRD